MEDFEKLQVARLFVKQLQKDLKAARTENGVLSSEVDELKHALNKKVQMEKLTPNEKIQIKKDETVINLRAIIQRQKKIITDLRKTKQELVITLIKERNLVNTFKYTETKE